MVHPRDRLLREDVCAHDEFWVTSNNGGCSFTDATITCPNACTGHMDFQQSGFIGVDNPAFRPAIDLPVDLLVQRDFTL